MTVRLTSAVFGGQPNDVQTRTAAEEKWLIDNGYAHVEPKGTVTVGPSVTYTPAEDPTLAVNREDVGDAYQFGTDTALPARIEAITPNTGPVTGGTVVTITGDNMIDATSVTFGGIAGTAFTVVSDNEVRVTTPDLTTVPNGSQTAGAKDVGVVDPSGTTTSTGGFTAT